MHFRILVSRFRVNYHAAKKGAKGQLSKRLTNFVRHRGGRFLQKDEEDGMWYECGDQRAHGKCAQALREGAAEVMRLFAGGSGNSDDGDEDGDDDEDEYGDEYDGQSGSVPIKPTQSSRPDKKRPSSNASTNSSSTSSEAPPRASVDTVANRDRMTKNGASPRCVIVRQESNSASADRGEQRRPVCQSRPVLDQSRPAMDQARPESRESGSLKIRISQGVKPPVMISEDRPNKEDGTQAHEASRQYEDESTDEESSVSDVESRRKRMKVHHIDENQFDYI